MRKRTAALPLLGGLLGGLLVPSLLLLPGGARADEPPPLVEEDPGDAGCLDDSDHKGVQKRDFLKRRRLELSAWGGFFASDLYSSSYSYGGALDYFLTEDLGVEASVIVSPFEVPLARAVAQAYGGARPPRDNAVIVVGNLVWSLVHLKVKVTEHTILHGDLAFTLGAGAALHDSVQGVALDGGLGLRVFLTRWLAMRFDLRDYWMVQEAYGVQRTVNNLVGVAGLSVYIPPWL